MSPNRKLTFDQQSKTGLTKATDLPITLQTRFVCHAAGFAPARMPNPTLQPSGSTFRITLECSAFIDGPGKKHIRISRAISRQNG